MTIALKATAWTGAFIGVFYLVVWLATVASWLGTLTLVIFSALYLAARIDWNPDLDFTLKEDRTADE